MLLSVTELAASLRLNPQTVYRKLKRGEIPCIRVGRTIRFDSEIVLHAAKSDKGKTSVTNAPLPSFLADLFWDTNPGSLSSSDSIVIERILEFGDIAAVRWLMGKVLSSALVQFLYTQGAKRLSDRSYCFWCEHFGVSYEAKRSSKETTRTLGKTGWR